MKSFVITSRTQKGNKIVKQMYERKNSKVKHQLLSTEPFSFRSIITDRGLKKKPHSCEQLRDHFGLMFRAAGGSKDDFELECEK